MARKAFIKKAVAAFLVCTMLIFAPAAFTGCTGESFDISYTSWDLGTEAENKLERKMVKAFEERTGYKVKLIDIGNSGYVDNLNAAAARGNFADVVMMPNLPMGIDNSWLLDLADLAALDPDWQKIPKTIEEATHYGDKIYGVPSGMHMAGYFVNVNLLKSNNISIFNELIALTDYSYTVAEFEDVVRLATKINQSYVGLSAEQSVIDWYPSVKNADYGYFTFDGEQYNLDSKEFKDGINLAKRIRADGQSFDALNEDDRAKFADPAVSKVWDAGQIALRWGYSYEVTDMQKNANFEQVFIGLPEGRVVVLGDFYGIKAETTNKQLAYDFAKWMSFDPEGIAKRLALDVGDVIEFNSLPLSTDAAVISAYFDKEIMYKGLREAFIQSGKDKMGVMEGTKVVPNYDISRAKAATGIPARDAAGADIANANIGQLLDACILGYINYSDHSAQINTLANARYLAGLEALGLR